MNGPKRQLAGAPLIGRRIGIALFWCMAAFVVTASTRSVLMELYGTRDPTNSGDPAETVKCAESLKSLQEALLEQASGELVAPADQQNARLRRWLTDWDRKFAATSDGCAALSETRHTLQSLRERVEAMLRAYARDEVPLTERIQRALQRYLPRSTLPRKT
jgi:hypothetical protein